MTVEVVKQVVGVAGPLLVCLSLELCGRGQKLGFLLGFVVQVCNLAIGLLFGIVGFIYGSGLTAVFFYRQYLRWRRATVSVRSGRPAERAALVNVPSRLDARDDT